MAAAAAVRGVLLKRCIGRGISGNSGCNAMTKPLQRCSGSAARIAAVQPRASELAKVAGSCDAT